jgi:hypothetical protein
MLKDSVEGTLLAAYFPPVVIVTTGFETFRLVLVGLSMEISVARERPIKVTLVMRGLRVRTTEYTLNRFKPKALKPRYNSVPVIPMANRFFIGRQNCDYGNVGRDSPRRLLHNSLLMQKLQRIKRHQRRHVGK